MDNIYYVIQSMLPVAIPLLVVALGGMYSERSGVINIALEGIMMVGAFVGALFVLYFQDSNINVQVLFIIAMIAAGLFGIIYSMLLSYAAVNMKANQVITGTAMNMFIPALILLFCKMTFNSDSVTTSVNLYIREVPLLSDIPVLGDLFFQNTYLTVYFGFLILAIATIVLYKTRFGLRLRACGEHPHAADSVGINVGKMRYAGVGISGFLAGVGGYFYSVGILNSNISGHSGVAGYGFLALAVMIFGQWKPIRIMFGALFFAFLLTLSNAVPLFPVLNNLGIEKAYYKMLPYLVTLIVLIFTSKTSKAPKAEGIPYDLAKR